MEHNPKDIDMGYIALADLIIDAKSGFASGKNEADGTIQIRMNNVNTDGAINWDKVRRIPASEAQVKKYALQSGDVLFNATNSPNLVGKSAFFIGYNEPVVYSNHFIRLQTNQKRLSPEYFARWLTYMWECHIFEGMCTQWVNQATVRKEDLLALKIPLPSLNEQCRIAAILDKADAIRRKRAKALELADAFLKSVFLEMFGDPVTNPKGWPVVSLKHAAKFISGGTPSKNIPEYWEGNFPWISPKDMKKVEISDSIDHISEDAFEKTGLKQVLPGAILIVVRGMILAHTVPIAIATRRVAINQDLKAIARFAHFQSGS